MKTGPLLSAAARARLRRANLAVAKAYPGASAARQPVHTVYGGAHLFKADTGAKLAELARRAFEEYAPDAGALAECLGLPGGAFSAKVHERVGRKLREQAVEDFRIDFEDGYGHRSDEEEDRHAEAAGREVAKGLFGGTLPPFIGLRLKPFSEELFGRAARTLGLFVSALARESRAHPPETLLVTLPKVSHPEQPAALAAMLGALEKRHRLRNRALRCELMIETPQSILGPDGTVAAARLVAAAGGRCAGVHLGAYDYTALLDVTSSHQRMTHPACDFAKHALQVSLAQTGVALSDGATVVLPVGPHKAAPEASLSPSQREENRAAVWRAWRMSYEDIRHSLEGGFYQGWDLHPAQLPVRYAAVYAFFLEGLDAASARLRAFLDRAARATLTFGAFDDAATGHGLLNFFLRGLACGALTPEEAQAAGVSVAELESRSFRKILDGRRK